MKVKEKKTVRSDESVVKLIRGGVETEADVFAFAATLTLIKEEAAVLGDGCVEYEIVGSSGSGSMRELVCGEDIAKRAAAGESFDIRVVNAETEFGTGREALITGVTFNEANIKASGEGGAVFRDASFTFREMEFIKQEV